MVLEIISGIFLITGSTFMLIASIGILRFPDFLMRMHASTKAGSLGASTLVIGAALMFPTTEVFTRAITTIIFILLTAPVAAHVIGRAAYHIGVEIWEGTLVDELREDMEKGKVHDEKLLQKDELKQSEGESPTDKNQNQKEGEPS
ncbi:MAG TPA: monovalent cation/H(+) antiporter subunit G [Balneolaceae bacterium]|nr:monovalent cation/H(+) antiporter subunit G [Balneolaceae bacterium]